MGRKNRSGQRQKRSCYLKQELGSSKSKRVMLVGGAGVTSLSPVLPVRETGMWSLGGVLFILQDLLLLSLLLILLVNCVAIL